MRYCGANGKANVGISNDNAGENPARRKVKDSRQCQSTGGKSGPKSKPKGHVGLGTATEDLFRCILM